MSNLTIYNCQEIIRRIDTIAEQNDGILTDEQLQELVLAQTTSLAKLGSLCGFMKFLEHGIDACKKEEERIAAMHRAASNRLASVKKFLLPHVLEKGKITVDTFRLSTRKSTSVELADGFNNMEYCNEIVTIKPDKKKIKEALQDGRDVRGAVLSTTQHLQLK